MRGISSRAPRKQPATRSPKGVGHDVSGALPSRAIPGQETGDAIVANADVGWLQQLIATRAEVPLLMPQQVARRKWMRLRPGFGA